MVTALHSSTSAKVHEGRGLVFSRGHFSSLRDARYLIYIICPFESLVRWCLDHGARVPYPDADEFVSYPPLLEIVAKDGTVSTFKLLLSHGAKPGRRTLHRAVESTESAMPERMEMVRFLVEEMGMDVPEGAKWPNHWGTPMAYAAHTSGGEEVVRYLLEVSFFFFSLACGFNFGFTREVQMNVRMDEWVVWGNMT